MNMHLGDTRLLIEAGRERGLLRNGNPPIFNGAIE